MRDGGDRQIDRWHAELEVGRPGGDAGRAETVVGLRELGAPRGAAGGALKSERRVGQAQVQGRICHVAQPGRKALAMCAHRIETDDLPQGRHRGPDLGHHRLGRRMHEDHLAVAGLQDVDDVGDGGPHVEVAPGEAGAHATQHGNQGWAGVGAHDRELVTDPQPRCPEPTGDAIAQRLGLEVGEVAAVATQGQTMRVIAGAQKEEIGDVHRLFPRATCSPAEIGSIARSITVTSATTLPQAAELTTSSKRRTTELACRSWRQHPPS